MSNSHKPSANNRVSQRIQAGKLARRLEAFALVKPEDADFDEKSMTQGQVAAARILLAKTVPDRKQVEQTIRDERVKTRKEIDDALVAQGINPADIWEKVRVH